MHEPTMKITLGCLLFQKNIRFTKYVIGYI